MWLCKKLVYSGNHDDGQKVEYAIVKDLLENVCYHIHARVFIIAAGIYNPWHTCTVKVTVLGLCVCVLGLGYIKKEEHIHKHRSVGGSCHCTQLLRHQNRPNPNATETNTPAYLHVAEYKLITRRFKDTNSGRQGSSLSFIMNCVFRPL